MLYYCEGYKEILRERKTGDDRPPQRSRANMNILYHIFLFLFTSHYFKDAKKPVVNVKQELSFHYSVPFHLTGATAKINSLTFNLKADEGN